MVCRNILRTGVLEAILENPKTKVLLLFPKRNSEMPEYLRQEFSHPRITIEEVEEAHETWLSRLLVKTVLNNLIYTSMTDLLARDGSNKVKPVPAWWYPFHKRLFGFLGRRRWPKTAARRFEKFAFGVTAYDDLFRKYRPAVLFAGSIVGNYDAKLIKAAQRHGAKVVAMQKGWDNLQKLLIRNLPDLFLVQNPVMIQAAVEVQGLNPATVRCVGFPQFDLYTRPQDLPSREAFMGRLGLDPDSKLVLFGSGGHWTPNDDRVVDELLEMRERGDFPEKISFILRPHFSDVQKRRYDRFKGLPGVFVDDEYRWSTYFYDYWDPSKEDMARLAADLHHSALMLCHASTMSLDAACFDKPIINIAYGSFIRPDGTDGTANLFKMEHYQPVIESGGVEIVWTAGELKDAIIKSLVDPSYRSAGRAKLRETMCGPLDGRAARRIAEACLELAG